MHQLEDLGWNETWAPAFTRGRARPDSHPARIVAQHRGSYRAATARGEFRAVPAGRLRLAGADEQPAVGDWVELVPGADPAAGTAVIHGLLPRQTVLARKAAGREARRQVLAANVDTALLLTSANEEFNARRLERFVAMVLDGGALPVIVLTKIDLATSISPLLAAAEEAAPGRPIVSLSSLTGEGFESLEPHLAHGKTAALVGSSGVGKSTLVNKLLGEERLATQEVREGDARGRHTTTHRELIQIPAGGCLIDSPGLREVGMLGGTGVEEEFEDVETLALLCRFSDCRHEREPDCAVRQAIEDGLITRERLASHGKLQREASRQLALSDARIASEARKTRRRFSKGIRRMMAEKDRLRGPQLE